MTCGNGKCADWYPLQLPDRRGGTVQEYLTFGDGFMILAGACLGAAFGLLVQRWIDG